MDFSPTTHFWFLVTGTLVAICLSSVGCKANGVEAHCYSNSSEEGGVTQITGFQCFAKSSRCSQRREAKASAASKLTDEVIVVGMCEKTTKMFCAQPSSETSYLVCAPTQADCDAVAAFAKAGGRPTLECENMSREELDSMRNAEKKRRKSKAASQPASTH